MNILISIIILAILCLYSIMVYHQWRKFRDLDVGDICGRFVDTDSMSDCVTEKIIKVDKDDDGYTTKIYTENNSFSFWQFMRNDVISMYGD